MLESGLKIVNRATRTGIKRGTVRALSVTGRMKRFKQRKTKRAEREAKALAARDRRAWLLVGMVVVGVSLYFFIVARGFVPRAHPEQLVKAQIVHGRALRLLKAVSAERSGTGANTIAESDRTQVAERRSNGGTSADGHSEYCPIEFGTLSRFPFVVTEKLASGSQDSTGMAAEAMEQIPADVRALDGKPVSLKGFMLPIQLEGAQTTDFLLLKNQMLCCYGTTPRITEWVNVRMGGKGVKVVLDQPLAVCGTFHVGELRENGDLVGIYRLDGEMVRPGKE